MLLLPRLPILGHLTLENGNILIHSSNLAKISICSLVSVLCCFELVGQLLFQLSHLLIMITLVRIL